jgi:hypothetical protein
MNNPIFDCHTISEQFELTPTSKLKEKGLLEKHAFEASTSAFKLIETVLLEKRAIALSAANAR